MSWGAKRGAVARPGHRPPHVIALVEVTVPGAADERGPFRGSEHEGRPIAVAGVADRDLAVRQPRDLDAVAALRSAPAALAPRHLGQFGGGHSVTDAHRLLLQVIDDRGEDSWCLARLGAYDAQPL